MSNTFESNVKFADTVTEGNVDTGDNPRFQTRPGQLRKKMSEQSGLTVFQLMAVRFRDERAQTHKTTALLIEAEHEAGVSDRSDEWLEMSKIVILASHFLALPTPATPLESQTQAKNFAKLVKQWGLSVEHITDYLTLDD